MKIVFASDIHGNEKQLRQIVDYCLENNADRLVLTGDISGIFSYGISSALEPFISSTCAVLGNCDSESYISSLGIYYERDYGVLRGNGFNIFYTHGHIYNRFNPPPGMQKGDVLVSGHTHIPTIVSEKGCMFANPGSAARPRGGSPKSFMVYDGESFTITGFEGDVILRKFIGVD